MLNGRNDPRWRLVPLLAPVLLFHGCGAGNLDDASDKLKEPVESSTESGAVSLTPDQVELAGIKALTAERSTMRVELRLNGEVEFNLNRLVHVTPRVAGSVQQVIKTAGDRVDAGQVLIVVASQDFASAKSTYLAARQRLSLAESTFKRLKALWSDKIAAQREYLDAKQAFAEARVEFQTTQQALYTFGLSRQEVDALPRADPSLLNRYEVRAPFAGTLVRQRVSQGEQVQAESELFTLTPIENVWVIASVYEESVALIKPGQAGRISVAAYPDREFQGNVTWIADALDERTRTLKIRLEVPNEQRLLKSGMFANVVLAVGEKSNVLTIPAKALQTESDGHYVFLEHAAGRYQRKSVTLGLRSEDSVECTSGINEGDRVVAEGAFILESELEKESFSDND